MENNNRIDNLTYIWGGLGIGAFIAGMLGNLEIMTGLGIGSVGIWAIHTWLRWPREEQFLDK